MGIIYNASQASTANSTSADSVSLAAATSGPGSGILREFCVAGLATASAANEILLQRCTGGTIATVMQKFNEGAAASLIFFGLAQATTGTTSLYRFGVNGNGALFRWVAAPGLGIEYRAQATSERIGFRGVSGTSLMATNVVCEQI